MATRDIRYKTTLTLAKNHIEKSINQTFCLVFITSIIFFPPFLYSTSVSSSWNCEFISLIHIIFFALKLNSVIRITVVCKAKLKIKTRYERLMLTLFSRKINFLYCRASPFMDENRVHFFNETKQRSNVETTKS
jgi:hypothetical protein